MKALNGMTLSVEQLFCRRMRCSYHFIKASAEERRDVHNSMEADMSDPTNKENFPTVIGPDASLKGEMSFDKGMRIEGTLEGRVQTPGEVYVAQEAKLHADVEAGSMVIEGDVRGNLTVADRIEMKSNARYEGDLRANKLVVEEGASFSGNVIVGAEAGTSSSGSSDSSSGSYSMSQGGGTDAASRLAALEQDVA